MFEHIDTLSSHYVPSRPIDVWLPPQYEADESLRLPVLYMHDGQNLFDGKRSHSPVSWGMDTVLTQLITAGEVPPVIVVGIWHGGERRLADYLPQRPFETPTVQAALRNSSPMSDRLHQHEMASDAYLKFLVNEVKPLIDARYRTRPEREATFVMGSSMGGLISLYALCEYPDTFAGAGCVSTHWPAGGHFILAYAQAALPQPGRHKVYFDFGTETLDAAYEPYQQRMDAIMAAAGYRADVDWLTRKFEGADHSEGAWRQRVDLPLRFLLGE